MEPITLIAGAGVFLARKMLVRAAKGTVMNHLEKSNLVGEQYYLKKILDSKDHDEALTYMKKLKVKFPDSSNIPVIVELLAYSLNGRKKEIEACAVNISESIKKIRVEEEELRHALKKCENRIAIQIRKRKRLILMRPLFPALICIPLVFIFGGIVYHPDAVVQRAAATLAVAGLVFAVSSVVINASVGQRIQRQMEVKQAIVDLIGHFHVQEASMEGEARSLRATIPEINRRLKQVYEIGGVEHA